MKDFLLRNFMRADMFVIEVDEVRGKCPVYVKGDKIVIDGPKIIPRKTDAICIHALPSLLHYIVALREGVDPEKLGLSKNGKKKKVRPLFLQ